MSNRIIGKHDAIRVSRVNDAVKCLNNVDYKNLLGIIETAYSHIGTYKHSENYKSETLYIGQVSPSESLVFSYRIQSIGNHEFSYGTMQKAYLTFTISIVSSSSIVEVSPAVLFNSSLAVCSCMVSKVPKYTIYLNTMKYKDIDKEDLIPTAVFHSDNIFRKVINEYHASYPQTYVPIPDDEYTYEKVKDLLDVFLVTLP